MPGLNFNNFQLLIPWAINHYDEVRGIIGHLQAANELYQDIAEDFPPVFSAEEPAEPLNYGALPGLTPIEQHDFQGAAKQAGIMDWTTFIDMLIKYGPTLREMWLWRNRNKNA